ncbi:hypothetical protein MKX70_00915 [Paenibacillus sp. FSL R7-0312]|uniref:hypothetical protein n=1 Tax=Paenibacillus sp. FSL R7-0312 TaxID=2921682 RepID=UPI0030F9114B
MKYKNYPATPLVGRGMLPFVEQFSNIAGIVMEMLYYGHDFQQAIELTPQKRVEIVKFLRQQP